MWMFWSKKWNIDGTHEMYVKSRSWIAADSEHLAPSVDSSLGCCGSPVALSIPLWNNAGRQRPPWTMEG